jgi:hypothetical protein
MSPRDLALWRPWLAQNATRFTAWFFDVALGEPYDPGPHMGPNYRYAAIRLSRLRADAVGVSPQGWTLIEVRPFAGASALGALLTYLTLWRTDPPDQRPITGLLVTNDLRKGLDTLYRSAGLQVQLAPHQTTASRPTPP